MRRPHNHRSSGCHASEGQGKKEPRRPRAKAKDGFFNARVSSTLLTARDSDINPDSSRRF